MQWAERCFNSLRSSSIRPDVFVVDNGSTDGTQTYIHEHYPEVIFQQSKKNLGFGKANNIGLKYALDNDFDYVYLLNQDAWVMPDTFEKLIEISQKYPEYGILSPFQMNADLYHIDVNIVENTCSWRSNKDILNDFYNCNIAEIYPIGFVMAAHWLIPCSVLRKIGGFSPSFPHYGEDGNYIDRVRWYKMKIGIAPRLIVVHDRGWREDSKKKKLHICYTSNIKHLSNTNISIIRSSTMVLCYSIRCALELKSLRPFWDLLKIIMNLYSIVKNRMISMKCECAFLNNNCHQKENS